MVVPRLSLELEPGESAPSLLVILAPEVVGLVGPLLLVLAVAAPVAVPDPVLRVIVVPETLVLKLPEVGE